MVSPSPDRSSPDLSPPMTSIISNAHVPLTGVNKRYRPAPAKTFQCRGYGDCRMVFSRSEHLARHIRKHTGERPFTCHCSKQFSRLDNLRQHAQTVHADKQEQNETMMRDLTSLHATMAAANKMGHSRGPRRPPPSGNPHALGGLGSANGNGPSMNLIKQEDLSMPIHQRPGTSTGYEGDHDSILYHQPPASWHVDGNNPTNKNHSFRDPSQSFLAPSASASANSSHSFLASPGFSSTFNFSLPDSTRPGSSSSRPPTSGGNPDDLKRSLPPLSAVVSASISSAPSQNSFTPSLQQSSLNLLPFPPSFSSFRRPSTATRPGTAPASASFFSSKSGGNGLASRSELPILYGRPSADMGPHYDPEFPSSPAGHESPFYFHPPESQPPPPSSASPSTINSRKRPFAGPDGPYDDPAPSAATSNLDYDYGSESRPQSRRLSVMELCNDPSADSGVGAFLLSASSSGPTADSRPSTSSGLVLSASALALVDRSPSASSPILPRASQATTGSITNGSGNPQDFGGSGGRISPTLYRGLPSSASPTATSSSILSYRTSAATTISYSPTFSTSSYSPRSASVSDSSFSPRSPVSDAASAAISRREQQHDQVRISVSPHASAALGMRV